MEFVSYQNKLECILFMFLRCHTNWAQRPISLLKRKLPDTFDTYLDLLSRNIKNLIVNLYNLSLILVQSGENCNLKEISFTVSRLHVKKTGKAFAPWHRKF